MSNLWDVPAYLIMAFSLAFDAQAGKASRVSLEASHVRQSQFEATRPMAPSELLAEDAWLRAIKIASPKSDALARYGARIFVTTSGRYYVPSDGERREIVKLRENAGIAARVISAAAQALESEIEKTSGRKPGRAAVYIATLYGPAAAISYQRMLETAPDTPVTAAVPQLSAAIGLESAPAIGAYDRLLRTILASDSTEVADDTPGQVQNRDRGTVRGPIKGTLTTAEKTGTSRVAAAP